MTKSWREVADSDAFLALPKGERDAARRRYFDQVVAPKLDNPLDRRAAREQFMGDTMPDLASPRHGNPIASQPELTSPDDLMVMGDAGSGGPAHEDPLHASSALQRAAIAAEPYAVPAMKTAVAVASGYPVAETAANLATGAAALPIAGIAGLVAQGAKVAGFDIDPVHVIRWTEEALTYQPRTELGKHLTSAATWPLEKLDQLAMYLGGKTLDATGSPAAATAVETAVVGGVPLLLPAAAKEIARGVPDSHVVDHNLGRPESTVATQKLAEAVEHADAELVARRNAQPAAAPIQTDTQAPDAQPAAPGEAVGPVADASLPESATESPRGAPPGDVAIARAGRDAERQAERGGAARAVRPVEGTPRPAVARESAVGEMMVNDDHDDQISGRGTGPAASSAPRSMLVGAPVDTIPENVLRYIGEKGGEEARQIAQAELKRRAATETTATASDGATAPVTRPEVANADAAPGRAIFGRDPRTVSDGALQLVGKRGSTEARAAAQAEMARRAQSREEYSQGVPTGELPLRPSEGRGDAVDRQAHEAASSPRNALPEPTKAQKAAGNYAKGHLQIAGLDITIENPEGSLRTWRRADGTTGETTMRAHYGYLKATKDRTGEQIDVFVKPGTRADYEGPVFVADTNKPGTRRADEYKVMLGWKSTEEARHALRENYDKGWDGLHAVTEFADPKAFRYWLEHGDTTKRVSAQAVKLPGAQHVGFIDDAKIAPTHSPETPIRREAILAPLLKALDVSVYEGRIKGNRILGYYMPHKELVRTKRASDLETVAHEIAHLIDDRVLNGFGRQRGKPNTRPWIADMPEAKTMAAELRSVSYDRRKTYEGFAEYVRLWMTQPEVASTRAPNFTRWFDQFVEASKYGRALKDARRGMLDWFHQDALNRARSKIGPQAEINDSLNGMWDRFRQAVVDDLHGVYRMERELKGETVPLGAYETSRLTRASGAITEGAIRYGAPFVEHDGSIRWLGKGLEQVLEPVSKTPKQLDDFLLYLVGRSAKELKDQGRERLFTDAEINAMLALEKPEFKQAALDYQMWNMRILNFAEAKGLINPAARASWRRAEYLPFHRVGTTTERARGGVSGNWHGIKTLTGGTENIRDVLGNIIGNAHMLIDAALKNEARAKIVELAEKTRGGGRFLQAIPPEARPVKIDKQQLKDKLIETAGGNPRNPPPQLEIIVDQLLANAPHLVDFLVKGQAPGGGNVIAVLKQGKPFYYEVADPILYRAVVALNRPAQSALVRWLSIPKRIGQASIVLTPDFQIANIARDTLMGAVMSRAGSRPAVDSIRGLIGRMTKDKDYLEYIANGGGFASYLRDERAFKAHLDRFYSERGINAKTVLDAPDKLLFFLETLFDSFEVSTRLGEYKRLRAQGVHPRHAAYLSREVSTDFAMKGDSQILGFLYDTVMFLRPAVVSMDRLYRGLAHDPNRGAIAAKAGAIALASAALYLVNRDNSKYQELPDWERDAYWHFFVPRPNGEELHFRYPKIWEVGALGSLAERSVERILTDEPKEFAGDLVRVIGEQFNLSLVPQAVAPLYEQARNEHAYTGRPIEPEGLKNLQPFKRATPGTSETMKELGMTTRNMPEALQVNPVRAEALLRGYLNTWAWYGLLLSDSALFADKMPERRLDQYPVIRRFFRQEPPLDTKSEELFYDMLGEARRLKNTMRRLRREGNLEAANEIAREPLTRYSVGLENMARVLAARRRKATRVRQSDLSPAEKRNQLDEIQAQMNTIHKHAVSRVRNRPGKL